MTFPKRAQSPIRYALLYSGIYFLVAVTWVGFSSWLVSVTSTSIQEMGRIEELKGYAFVFATSIMFFIFSLAVFKRIVASADEILRHQQRLVQTERDAMAGLVASSVLHDFSNLLTVLRLNTQLLADESGLSDRAQKALHQLDQTVSRLAELTARTRSVGRHIFRESPRTYDAAETILETLDLIKAHQTVKDCTIDLETPEPLQAHGYSILLHQCVMNLVLNAAEATEGRGRILVRARRHHQELVVEVHDNGPGIAPDIQAHLFDAFFTTKRYGSGLGLMSVKSCVDIHEGSVSVDRSPLGGTVFVLVLPDLDEARVSSLKVLESLNKTRSLSPQPTVH